MTGTLLVLCHIHMTSVGGASSLYRLYVIYREHHWHNV